MSPRLDRSSTPAFIRTTPELVPASWRASRTASVNSRSPRAEGGTRRHASSIDVSNRQQFMLRYTSFAERRQGRGVGLLDDVEHRLVAADPHHGELVDAVGRDVAVANHRLALERHEARPSSAASAR